MLFDSVVVEVLVELELVVELEFVVEPEFVVAPLVPFELLDELPP